MREEELTYNRDQPRKPEETDETMGETDLEIYQETLAGFNNLNSGSLNYSFVTPKIYKEMKREALNTCNYSLDIVLDPSTEFGSEIEGICCQIYLISRSILTRLETFWKNKLIKISLANLNFARHYCERMRPEEVFDIVDNCLETLMSVDTPVKIFQETIANFEWVNEVLELLNENCERKGNFILQNKAAELIAEVSNLAECLNPDYEPRQSRSFERTPTRRRRSPSLSPAPRSRETSPQERVDEAELVALSPSPTAVIEPPTVTPTPAIPTRRLPLPEQAAFDITCWTGKIDQERGREEKGKSASSRTRSPSSPPRLRVEKTNSILVQKLPTAPATNLWSGAITATRTRRAYSSPPSPNFIGKLPLEPWKEAGAVVRLEEQRYEAISPGILAY